MTKEQAVESFGDAIDRIDNLLGAMKLSMPAKFHLDQLQGTLPEISGQLKNVYKNIVGQNPWDY